MRILMLQPNTEQNIQIKLCNGVTINTHYWKIVDKFLDKSKICWALSNVDSSACPIIFTLGPNHKYQGEGSKLRLIQHLWKALWHQTENSIAPIKNIARGLKSLKLAAQTTMSYKKGIINIVKEVESKHLPYRKSIVRAGKNTISMGLSAECFAQLENLLITALLGALATQTSI